MKTAIPQSPSLTDKNTLQCLTDIKYALDALFGRSGEIPENRLLEVVGAFGRNLTGVINKLTTHRLVIVPSNKYGSPSQKLGKGEIVNTLSGSLFLGRGGTALGQLLDSGATLRGASWSFTSGSNQIIPRGFYMATPVAGTVRLDIQDGTWQTANANFTGGLLMSDGTNVRLFETGASTATVDYLKVGP